MNADEIVSRNTEPTAPAAQATAATEPEPLFPDGVPAGVTWGRTGRFPKIHFDRQARTLTVEFGCDTCGLPREIVDELRRRLYTQPITDAMKKALAGSDRARQYLAFIREKMASEDRRETEAAKRLAPLAKAAADRWTAERVEAAKTVAARLLPELTSRIQARIAELNDQDFFAPFRESLEQLLILSALADALRAEEGAIPACAYFLTPQEVLASENAEAEPEDQAATDPAAGCRVPGRSADRGFGVCPTDGDRAGRSRGSPRHRG